GLELADQRNPHAADEADDLRSRDQPGDRADEKAALVLAKPQAGEVRQLAHALRRRVIDAGELHVRELPREALEIRTEDEADTDHQIEVARGQRAQRALAIGALARLDVLDLHAELLARALEPAPRCFVERLVVLAADVEHEADANARAHRRVARR